MPKIQRMLDRKKSEAADVNDIRVLLELWRGNKLKYLGAEEMAACYEKIIDLCTNGWNEQTVSPRGEILTIKRRDLKGATQALKEYRCLINQVLEMAEGSDRVQLVINLKEAKPAAPLESESDDQAAAPYE